MGATRRRLCERIGLGLVAIGTGVSIVCAQAAGRRIKISARKFVFTPNEIKINVNEPVTFEFTAEDVLMGFNAPDLAVRIDLLPGKVQTLRLVPSKVGEFEFVCDIFCGEGHEKMSGKIVVVA